MDRRDLITRPHHGEPIKEAALFERILVAIDGSPTSAAALAVASRLAEVVKATIRVVSVVERVPDVIGLGAGLDRPPAFQQVLRDESDQALARARDLLALHGVPGDTLSIDVGENSVASALDRAAQEWQADLIVLGTHGRRGARRLVLGSVAESFTRLSTLPVLLVPHHASKDGTSGAVPTPEHGEPGGH
ncbi:universal stress protein [Cupriavidus basilensis]